jgi:hypothetical protein
LVEPASKERGKEKKKKNRRKKTGAASIQNYLEIPHVISFTYYRGDLLFLVKNKQTLPIHTYISFFFVVFFH